MLGELACCESVTECIMDDPNDESRFSFPFQNEVIGPAVSLKRSRPTLNDVPGRDTVTFESLSSPLFQQLLRKHNKGGTLKAALAISLEESAIGGRKMIEVRRLMACGACFGVDVPFCMQCKGEHVLEAQHIVEVGFHCGVSTGYVVMVSGAGDAAEEIGQEAEDLVVEIQVAPHPFLERAGDDCHTQLLLSFAQAALGCSVYIPSLYGEVRINVPPGTQSHTFIRIPGEGFPVFDQRDLRGSLVVKVIVRVPVRVSTEGASLLRQFDQTFMPD